MNSLMMIKSGTVQTLLFLKNMNTRNARRRFDTLEMSGLVILISRYCYYFLILPWCCLFPSIIGCWYNLEIYFRMLKRIMCSLISLGYHMIEAIKRNNPTFSYIHFNLLPWCDVPIICYIKWVYVSAKRWCR